MSETNLEVLFAAAMRPALRYRETLGENGHRPQRTYPEMRSAFLEPTPEHGNDGVAVIEELVGRAEPGLTAMAGPRFFGWVVGASHPVGVAADWLTSAWGQNAGAHTPTPSAAAAEETAAQWLLDLLDLPRECSVGFTTGATAANFVGLSAARGAVLRKVGWDPDSKGLFGAPEIHVFLGDDAHSSIHAALQYCGLGRDRVIRIGTDDQGRMDASALASAAAERSGPKIIVAQAGQINTGAFDPFPAIVSIAQEHKAWLHVDGAFGLWARAAPDRAHLTAGVEGADSWATDGHKWLQVPYDCGFAFVRDADAHMRAMSVTASYLPTHEAGDRVPFDLVPELSRRARGFATWAMIKTLGRDGISEMVERHCRIARHMAERLSAEDGVQIRNEVVLNQIVLDFGASDAIADERSRLTQAVIDRVQADDICFVSGARWKGRWVMRVSVSSVATDEAEGDRSAEAIATAWRYVKTDL